MLFCHMTFPTPKETTVREKCKMDDARYRKRDANFGRIANFVAEVENQKKKKKKIWYAATF